MPTRSANKTKPKTNKKTNKNEKKILNNTLTLRANLYYLIINNEKKFYEIIDNLTPEEIELLFEEFENSY
jgi:hypothetical protein